MINSMRVLLKLINKLLNKELKFTKKVLRSEKCMLNVWILINAVKGIQINIGQNLRNINLRLLNIFKSMDLRILAILL